MIDLSNLAEASEQEVFDQVKNHLLTQMECSVNEQEHCVYKSEEGLKCAAGCLIAEHQYDPKMEGEAWSGLVTQGIVPNAHEELIGKLQSIHDGMLPENWSFELEELAKERNLCY